MLEEIKKIIGEDTNKSYLLVNTIDIDRNAIIKDLNNHFSNTLVDVSYMSINELISRLNYQINDESIIKVMEEKDLSYNVAKLYLNNLLLTKYLDEQGYRDEKMDSINKVNALLKDDKLLSKDPFINIYLSNKEIIVYGRELDKFEETCLNGYKYQFVSTLDTKLNNELEFSKFKDNISEIASLFESISALYESNNNIDLQKDVYIVLEDKDYLYQLKRIAKMYDIEIQVPDHIALSSIGFVNELKDKIYNNEEIDVTDFDDEKGLLYKRLINVINRYPHLVEYKKYPDFINYKLDHTYKHEKEIGIKVISLKEAYSLAITRNNIYLFIIGASQGMIPQIKKDSDYYSDAVKEKYGILTSIHKNNISNQMLYTIMNSNNNVYMSYAKKSFFSEYIACSLIGNDDNVAFKEFECSKYSKEMNIELYNKNIDLYNAYGEEGNRLTELHNTYKDDRHKKYCNGFDSLGLDRISSFKRNELGLSYSAMDVFNKCPFKYYVSNFLRLDSDYNFNLLLGNAFHKAIEEVIKDNFNHYNDKDFVSKFYYDEINNELNKNKETYEACNKDKYFIDKLFNDLMDAIEFIYKQSDNIKYDNVRLEHEVVNTWEKKYNDIEFSLKFTGKLDKLLYKQVDDITYVAIIDYKTSSKISIERNNFQYGLSLQLPVYAYLSKHIEGFDNVKIGGLYIQPLVLNSVLSNDEDKITDYKVEVAKYLKLKGITNGEFGVDNNYLLAGDSNTQSSIQASFNITKDGALYANCKNSVATNQEIDESIKIVEKYINADFDAIANGKFNIEPKKIKKTDVSCDYCMYKDLCYKTADNYRQLDETYTDLVEDEEELEEGEDNNA